MYEIQFPIAEAILYDQQWGIENFRCNIGMSILHQGVKEIGQIPHGESIFHHLWLCHYPFFFLGKGLGQSSVSHQAVIRQTFKIQFNLKI